MLIVEGKNYVAFTDFRFVNEAKSELGMIFRGRAEGLRPLYGEVLLFRLDEDYGRAIGEFRAARPTFIYGLLQVAKSLYFDGTYDGIMAALKDILEEGRKFRIEVKNVWAAVDETAKDVEVLLGRAMEGSGLTADLSSPEVMVYVVLVNDRALICTLDVGLYGQYVMDPFRKANKSGYSALNRSEYKLAEAVESFGIDVGSVALCLDVGAAPGGWSNYMLKHGAKVVAVDSALLDYGKLAARSILVVTENGNVGDLSGGRPEIRIRSAAPGALPGDISEYDMVHIKGRAQDALPAVLGRLGKFDMALSDMNTTPEESAKVLDGIAGAIKEGGRVVLTIKLVDNRVQKHINDVKRILSQNYGGFMVKKLPHDRMELTAFAIKK